jgi:hypothetical protein
MAAGSLLVVGGDNNTAYVGGVTDGRKGLRTYNPCPAGSPAGCVGKWEVHGDMSSERWHPTVVTLGDGSQVIFGGYGQNLDFDHLDRKIDSPTYEYYPAKEGKWPRELQLLVWAWPHNLHPQSFFYLLVISFYWLLTDL